MCSLPNKNLTTETIGRILNAHRIREYGFLPLSDTDVLRPDLMPDGIRSVILLLAPYDDFETYSDGVSRYAHVLDYHLYYKKLFADILPVFRDTFPNEAFYGFSDHSPINEKTAAAKAGLGVIGMHSLLINEQYGSYVFIGGILTTMEITCNAKEIRHCDGCGLCRQRCPVQAIGEDGRILQDRCLSAISQKRKLTDAERHTLLRYHTAWGCDRCQECCPMNQNRKPTDIPYFQTERHGNFTSEEVALMRNEEFTQYAFSWRGRERIKMNLANIEQESGQTSPTPRAEQD